MRPEGQIGAPARPADTCPEIGGTESHSGEATSEADELLGIGRTTVERGDVEAEWIGIALEFAEQNHLLRRSLTQVLVWVWEREELRQFAEAEIERRWPTPAANAT